MYSVNEVSRKPIYVRALAYVLILGESSYPVSIFSIVASSIRVNIVCVISCDISSEAMQIESRGLGPLQSVSQPAL